jgi:hypothetical protein
MARYYIERWLGGSIWKPDKKEIIKTELTLEQAQAWCKDPETSSFNCTSDWGKALTEKYGVWMDIYNQHDPGIGLKVKFGGLSEFVDRQDEDKHWARLQAQLDCLLKYCSPCYRFNFSDPHLFDGQQVKVAQGPGFI